MMGLRHTLLALAGAVLLVAGVAAEQTKPAVTPAPAPQRPNDEGETARPKLIAPVRGEVELGGGIVVPCLEHAGRLEREFDRLRLQLGRGVDLCRRPLVEVQPVQAARQHDAGVERVGRLRHNALKQRCRLGRGIA